MSNPRLCAKPALLAFVATCCSGVMAQPEAMQGSERVEMVVIVEPTMTAEPAAWSPSASEGKATRRWWAGRSRLSAGLAASEEPQMLRAGSERTELANNVGRNEAASRDLLFSVRLAVGNQSQVVVDQVVLRGRNDPIPRFGNQNSRPIGVGLEFRPANAAQMAGLKQGNLFRVNLSSSSTLGLRARKGRMQVVWRAQW